MELKRILQVDTKPTKNSKAVRTVLTMDYTGVTAEMLQGPAEDSLVIAWQGRKRRGALATPAVAIPSTETVKVAELIASLKTRAGGPPTVDSTAAQFSSLSAEDQKAALAKLQELVKAQAKETRKAA